MVPAHWTTVEQAKAYIAACEKNKVKGLKYCSAIDFVANQGKERCTRCGKYNYPDEMVTKDADGNNILLCKGCHKRVLAERGKNSTTIRGST